MFAPTQARFAEALLDPEKPVPQGLSAPALHPPIRRFAVYRNNVVAGLIRALGQRFPVVQRIVGQEFFAAMARLFITAHPPRSPLLTTYGDSFSEFIASFEPARELPYLADVARLEAARTRAYHAADASTIDLAEMKALDPEALSRSRLMFHPSVEIVRSEYPIVTIWAMNAGELALGPIGDLAGEDALVSRRGLEVEVRALPKGGAAFLIALAAGTPLAAAADATAAEAEEFDLAANLAGLIGAEIVAGIRI